MFAALPLLVLPVALYNLLTFTFGPGHVHSLDAAARLAQPLLSVPLGSGVAWSLSLGDLLVVVGLVVLFVEFIRPPGPPQATIIHRSLSVALLVLCVVEFLLLPAFATSTFLILGLMVLLDLLAGLVLAFAGAGRD